MPEWKTDPELHSPCVRMERLGIELHVRQLESAPEGHEHEDMWYILLHATGEGFTPIIPELEGELFDTMDEAKTFAEDLMVAILDDTMELFAGAKKRAEARALIALDKEIGEVWDGADEKEKRISELLKQQDRVRASKRNRMMEAPRPEPSPSLEPYNGWTARRGKKLR